MPFLGEIGHIETLTSDVEFSLKWEIPKFLALSCEDGDYYQSRSFIACGGMWCIKMFPNGVAGITSARWVCVFLLRLDAGPSEILSTTLGIKGLEGVENMKEKVRELSEDDEVQVCSWIGFCLKSKLSERKSVLMPRNRLTLVLSMRTDLTRVIEDLSALRIEETESDEVCPAEHQSLEKQGGEKALDDFGKLLSSSENSDVTLQVGDAEFRVHSVILFARCPALSASLQYDTIEKATRRIVIKDSEPDVFRDFLQYLYTGSVLSLTEQNVFGLYQIADIYLAEDLKLQCLNHIGETLCVQTFCDTMRLALTHSESGLLQLATEYAAENIKAILISAEWQNFNCDYPQQANEILNKCFGPRS